MKDLVNLVELLKVNPQSAASLREHLERIHSNYFQQFDQLGEQADSERQLPSVD